MALELSICFLDYAPVLVTVPAPAFKGNRPCFLFPIHHFFLKMKIPYITVPAVPAPERKPSLLPFSRKATVPASLLSKGNCPRP
ncbi:hypothetical protein BDR07DRAFT_1368017, partial [Suillus spraguei]